MFRALLMAVSATALSFSVIADDQKVPLIQTPLEGKKWQKVIDDFDAITAEEGAKIPGWEAEPVKYKNVNHAFFIETYTDKKTNKLKCYIQQGKRSDDGSLTDTVFMVCKGKPILRISAFKG